MDHLREAYASSDEGEIEENVPTAPALGELPPELLSMFSDSEYDLATERRRAEQRAGDSQWVRRFPHERGNWPTYAFIPVPNSAAFVSVAEASVADFRRRLARAWEERHGSKTAIAGKKRSRNGHPSSNRKGEPSLGKHEPPEVVVNDMDPSGQQHLSLSKTVTLRAHEIEPFVQALQEAVKSSRCFTASIVSGYDVLVNDDKTRSFLCLRVRGGRQLILQLIGKVDTLMPRFKQSKYYEDPVVHVSVASVLGDVSSYVNSSAQGGPKGSGQAGGKSQRKVIDSEGRHAVDKSNIEEKGVALEALEALLPVRAVACKAGTTLFEAPLLPDH